LNVASLCAERAKPEVQPVPFAGTGRFPDGLMIGLDVGSTTVKAVVIDPATDEILWKSYKRHDTRQPEEALVMLSGIEADFRDVPHNTYRLFVTGSGGAALTSHLGGKFVQEVNAVSLAVEKLYPEAQSVVELGGQDAKIIIFKTDRRTGKKRKIPSMNDKCAGGTGAVIDKINAKLKISTSELCSMGYRGLKLHPVAGKCGVFAETDITSLQKQGIPADELMASLFESIVQQNLSVLTRGHTLLPTVLLLGGPNYYIKGMRECWQHNIPLLWAQRGVQLPDGAKAAKDYVVTPDDAQYFAAIGAVVFGKVEVADDPNLGVYKGRRQLQWYVDHGRDAEKQAVGTRGLAKNYNEMARFKARYARGPWRPPALAVGATIEAFIGLDGGSTSTKAVLLDRRKNIVAKAYRLSRGNPIEDSIDILPDLEKQVVAHGANLRILGVATTGYAKDILKCVLEADVALVETVAHTESGLHFYPEADVIVDVGGQDIKLIILKDGRVKDFKLNTQCSAGNGYFLQSTAKAFGYDVSEYADVAFTADAMPEFGYGCAVFMQSDIVDFQRRGWAPNEIMAGLAAVLPKNIWLYVSQIPNLAKLGRTFVLQGGTQHNLAAVKAQVDFIEARFAGTGVTPEIIVHEHCAESGAIGCALEAHRLWDQHGRQSGFIGMDAVKRISYRTTRDERTRCYFCKNKCLRTFIDVTTKAPPAISPARAIDLPSNIPRIGSRADRSTGTKHTPGHNASPPPGTRRKSRVPLQDGGQRLIIATCEKGTVEDVGDMREIKKGLDAARQAYPNLVEISAREVFKRPDVDVVSDALPRVTILNPWKARDVKRRRGRMMRRSRIRIGFPRVLNMYAQAPFFQGFFTSLGVPFDNLVWSDYTTEALYKAGAKRGAIDPCFPSKLGIPHIHNLLHVHHEKRPLTHIFFPMVDSFPTFLRGVQDSRACPTAVATPEATHAAFIKEGDMFGERNIVFKKTFLNLNEPPLCARQMYDDWKDELGLSREEAYRGVMQGLRALRDYQDRMRRQAREIIDGLEARQRLGLVLLARPYHNDPGVNHDVCAELQKLGYPILTQDSLPFDDDILDRLFGAELAAGGAQGSSLRHPLSIEDVWKNSYSENTSRKLWAAKYTARHPNLVALELSSFKCGHDAPIYSTIEEIIERSGTPYFCFKDIDENKSTGSIKIRIETIAYFLERYCEKLALDNAKEPREQGTKQGRHEGIDPYRDRKGAADRPGTSADRELVGV
jgi:activator of 2-hydroxyglutaryl-CoA dehydratase/predicted nucleotide-binding protein (sugar kinase/HSP70/actin superfamily)